MYTLAFVFMFVLGCIIGSFLNVVIYRFGSGRSIVKGRSMCMTCSKTLEWYELIPILSFIAQGGRCRRCRSLISYQYPIVEFSTGIIFALIAFHFLPYLFFSRGFFVFLVVLYSFIFSLLIVMTVYDIRHKVIPDKLVYVFIAVSFILLFINMNPAGPLFVLPNLLSLVAGPLCALPFALLWIVSRGKWIGLGDAKLILGIAWMLGLFEAFAALTISFCVGAVISLGILFFSRKKMTMKTEIPFAPFLILGTLITFLFSLDMFSLARLFQGY